jgi:hypothetical protein
MACHEGRKDHRYVVIPPVNIAITTMPWQTLVKPPRRADLDAILQRWLVDERPSDAILSINLQHHLTRPPSSWRPRCP